MKLLYVVIATRATPLTIQQDDSIAHVAPRQLKQGLERLGHQVDYFAIPGTVSRWNYLYGILKMLWMSLNGTLKQYDLIHAHYGYHGVVARCQFSRPLVLSLLGSDVYQKSERQIARMLVKFVAAVIVPSAKMIELIDHPADVIPYGTDIDIFKPMDSGTLREKYNLAKDKKLVLFPYDPARASVKRPDIIRAAVNKIEGAEMIIVHGQPSSVIAEYMNACDAFAMASSHEGSPVAIREALACNLPVVSVDVGDVKDHIGDVEGCYLCERDPDDMAAKLRLVFAAGRLKNGREHVLSMSIIESAKRNLEVYNRVLAKRRKMN